MRQSEASPKRRRMDRSEYLMICLHEVLRERGDKRSPAFLSEVCNPDNGYDPDIWDAARRWEDEMFGIESVFSYAPWADDEDFGPLWPVDRLTLAETAIAERTDLSHAAKLELIRPLRAKRSTRAEALIDRYLNRERNKPVKVSFEELFTVEDSAIARVMGITLD